MNKSGKHIDFLDHVRGLAILSVFLFHSLNEAFHRSSLPWNGWFRDFSVPKTFLLLLPASFGWAGVAVFFVVSGFCIHYSFHQQGRDWRGFFIRRFFRIYPPYLMAVFLFALLFLSKNLNPTHEYVDRYQIIIHLLLVHNFDPFAYYAVNPSFWSIAIEVQLYLIYPLLLMLVARFGWRRTVIIVAICELLIKTAESALDLTLGINGGVAGGLEKLWWFSRIFYWIDVSPFAYWFSWSLGACIADAFINGRALPLAKTPLVLWLALILASYFVRPLETFFFTLVAVFTAAAISKLLSAQQPGIFIPRFILGHLRLTGVWSYSIYLLHQPLIGMALGAMAAVWPVARQDALLRFALCLILWFAIMLVGGLWYQLCERPSIICGKRIA